MINPRAFVQDAWVKPAEQAAATRRQLAYATQPKIIFFSLPGLVPASTSACPRGSVTNPGPVATAPNGTYTPGAMGGQVSLVVATLGTVDSGNSVEIGFYLNGGSAFATLYIPATAVWAASTFYNYGDCVVGYTGYTAMALQAGVSGGSTPSFSSTPGDSVTDGQVIWQTVSQGYSSQGGGSNGWLIPGYGDDYFQVQVVAYAGSTASDIEAQVQI